MRKLSQVLPLVRQGLYTGPGGSGFTRVCYAATGAAAAGLITDEEDDAISERVMAEIAPLALLQSWLVNRGQVYEGTSVYSAEYVKARDAWLDKSSAQTRSGGVIMRKLSELLPIARKYLMVKAYDDSKQAYTCYAAAVAAKAGEMSEEEYWELSRFIQNRLAPNVFLRTRLVIQGMRPDIQTDEAEYFPHRDAWLDALQAEFEAKGL